MYPYKVPRNTGRLFSKVLRLLHRDTGPSIWLSSLYTLHICDFSSLLFQEMFSNIWQSEALLFQLSFMSSTRGDPNIMEDMDVRQGLSNPNPLQTKLLATFWTLRRQMAENFQKYIPQNARK